MRSFQPLCPSTISSSGRHVRERIIRERRDDKSAMTYERRRNVPSRDRKEVKRIEFERVRTRENRPRVARSPRACQSRRSSPRGPRAGCQLPVSILEAFSEPVRSLFLTYRRRSPRRASRSTYERRRGGLSVIRPLLPRDRDRDRDRGRTYRDGPSAVPLIPDSMIPSHPAPLSLAALSRTVPRTLATSHGLSRATEVGLGRVRVREGCSGPTVARPAPKPRST